MADDAKIEDTKLSDHDVFTQTQTSDHNHEILTVPTTIKMAY